jgi:HD-GYP domain-containing protein (c-di-GMP phosphodiesterase class II)
MGKLAVPVEIMEKQGRLTDFEYRNLRRASHKVDDLLSDVDFLRPMVNICSGAHPRLADEDFGQSGHVHTTKPSLEQKVLAVADAFDAMTSTRGYRMAFTQSRAFTTLREDETPLYDNDVIDALERGLIGVGQSYGPPDIKLESEEAAHA